MSFFPFNTWVGLWYYLCLIVFSLFSTSIHSPIRNLSPWQRWEWLEIADYGCLGNVNEARKSGYSRLPTEFLILETQLQATMIIIGISKCTQHVCESRRNSSHLRWWPTLSRLSLAFPCIPDDSVRYANDYCLNFEIKLTHTRTHTHARWRQFTV